MSTISTTPIRPIQTCKNLQDVRKNIDRIDEELILLLLERQGYVRQAGVLKNDANKIVDPERINYIINKMTKKAESLGLDTTLTKNLWTVMIESFIQYEKRIWEEHHNS